MDAMFRGRAMWVFKNKELTRVHPRRGALVGEGSEVVEKSIGDTTFVESV